MKTLSTIVLLCLLESTALAMTESQPATRPPSPKHTTPLRSEPVLRFEDVASGTWGFELEGASCATNPHTIAFSDDGNTMTLRYAKGVDGNPPGEATYRLLGEGAGYMRMEIVGETRTTDSGIPVKWDLILLTPNSYCWHRTDWQEGGCTQPATRCQSRPSP